MNGVTWALFRWTRTGWHFEGMTAHDERVTEYEETAEETGTIIAVVALEDPEAPLQRSTATVELPEPE